MIIGDKTWLKHVEKTLIDRCVRLVCRKYSADPKSGNMPILQDLCEMLYNQDAPGADYIAKAIETEA